jgi:hypothetical protein
MYVVLVCPKEVRPDFDILAACEQANPHGGGIAWRDGKHVVWRKSLDFAESEGHLIPPGPMSDARAAAWLCSIYGHKFLEKCEPSRWVYFSHQETALFGQWHNRQGISFSNLYWESRRVEPLPRSENVSNGQPAAHKTKLERELEVWDMSMATDYWTKLERSCPKPRKGH